MLIVIYRTEYHQMSNVYKKFKSELMKLLDPYTLICSGTKMFVGPDITIDFRCEFIGNMAGLTPNYYNSVDRDSYKFLSQSAAKVNGRRTTLSEILDIIKDYIENHRVKEMQEKRCGNCAYGDMCANDFPCSQCMNYGHWTAKKEKTLVGDITTGYRYVDTDKLVQASTTGLPMAQYALDAHKIAQEKDILNGKFDIEIRKENIKRCETCAYDKETNIINCPCNLCMTNNSHDYWTPKYSIYGLQASLEAYKAAQGLDFDGDIIQPTDIEIRKGNIMPPKMNYGDLYINGNLFGGLSSKNPTVKDIEILAGVTTLVWSDGDITMVTQGPDDEFDAEKAIAMAIAKKFMGTNESKSNYIEEIRRLEEKAMDKFVKRMEKAAKKEAKKKAAEFDGCMNPPVEPEVIDIPIKEFAEKAGVTVETVRRQCIKGQYPGAKKVAGKWYIPVKKEG